MAVEQLARAARDIASRRKLEVAWEARLDQATVAMDSALTSSLMRAVEEAGFGSRHMCSGAGHDAMIVGRHVPAGMLFAPSIGGRSHSEEEDTDPAGLVRAAQALTNAIARLRNG